MDNFEHKSYRAGVYKKLKEEPDHSKRRKIIEDEQTKPEYEKAKELKKKEKENNNKNIDLFVNDRSLKQSFVSILSGDYADLFLHKTEFDKAKKEDQMTVQLLEERLKGSVLVDLGCGGPYSVRMAYKFSSTFNVRKYIGIEKYPRSWEGDSQYNEYIKDGSLEGRTAPAHEIVLGEDMLQVLSRRTEQSNFMMNGIDDVIFSNDEWDPEIDFNKEEYIKKLCENIARLVPQNGIVFGINSVYLNNLARLGFKKRADLCKNNPLLQIWEKI